MDRRQLLQGLLLLAVALQGCAATQSPAASSTTALTTSLMSQLGVSAPQATGGIGAILSYAKSSLSPEKWDTVAKSIPGADSYLKTASDALGGGSITSAAGVGEAFSKLGMSPEMAKQFTPIVADQAGKIGGDTAKSLILGLF